MMVLDIVPDIVPVMMGMHKEVKQAMLDKVMLGVLVGAAVEWLGVEPVSPLLEHRGEMDQEFPGLSVHTTGMRKDDYCTNVGYWHNKVQSAARHHAMLHTIRRPLVV